MGNQALWIFSGLVLLRAVNSRLIETFFQPDEYFQALEPAWQWTFGADSGAWITWEWRERLRSSLHPLLCAAAYKCVDAFCDLLTVEPTTRANALLAAPGLLSATVAAVMDFSTWRLAHRVYGSDSQASFAALALTICSPWQWFASTRTFSNSLEATLTAAALAWFPWKYFLHPDSEAGEMAASSSGLRASLTVAAVAVILRPTNVIIWATLSALLVYMSGRPQRAFPLLQAAVLCGSAVLAASLAIDRAFYGEWAFPPLRFLYLNVVQSLSEFYGKNRVDYYFTEGLPLMLTTYLPFAGVGFWAAVRPRKHEQPIPTLHHRQQVKLILALTITTTVFALTAISHKEVRFIYPLLPVLHILAAQPFARHILSPILSPPKTSRHRIVAILLGTLLLSTNIFIAHYVTRVHQRGVVDITHWLRAHHTAALAAASSLPTLATSVAFLMPCHSTPWRSHLQSPSLHAWALTCEPPLNITTPAARAAYLDEADVFYLDPASWLAHHMHPHDSDADSATGQRPWPQFLVFFEPLEPALRAFHPRPAYREVRRFFNTHWIDDARRRGDVVVWRRD